MRQMNPPTLCFNMTRIKANKRLALYTAPRVSPASNKDLQSHIRRTTNPLLRLAVSHFLLNFHHVQTPRTMRALVPHPLVASLLLALHPLSPPGCARFVCAWHSHRCPLQAPANPLSSEVTCSRVRRTSVAMLLPPCLPPLIPVLLPSPHLRPASTSSST